MASTTRRSAVIRVHIGSLSHEGRSTKAKSASNWSVRVERKNRCTPIQKSLNQLLYDEDPTRFSSVHVQRIKSSSNVQCQTSRISLEDDNFTIQSKSDDVNLQSEHDLSRPNSTSTNENTYSEKRIDTLNSNRDLLSEVMTFKEDPLNIKQEFSSLILNNLDLFLFKSRRQSKIQKYCPHITLITILIGLVLGAIAAAVAVTMTQSDIETTTITITSTTSTSASTTMTTSTTTTSSNMSTTTTTTTTTTTLFYDACLNLQWNQTGIVFIGSSAGSAADKVRNPNCLYFDSNDTLYICDYNNHRIQKWFQGATVGITIAGSSSGNSGADSVRLQTPEDLVFDNNGYMYVTDTQNHRVQRFYSNSTNGTTVAGITNSASSALTNLKNPSGILIDDDLNLYILDMDNKRVLKWAPNGTNGTILISNNILDESHDLLFAIGSSDRVYISDRNDHVIYLWQFGALSPMLNLSRVNDTSSKLKQPRGLAFDPYGNLYVADAQNNRIIRYCVNSTDGNVVIGLGPNPSRPDNPMAVAFDSNLNLYIASRDDDRIIKYFRI